MNKILERQLKKVFGGLENVPLSLSPFLKVVSDTYDHAEEDRTLIERSLDISSRELGELNDTTRREAEELKATVEELGKSKTAILNLLEDIEEEKEKAELKVVERTKELSDEKARLLASINSLSFGFIIADLDDKIILQNPALLQILDIKTPPTSVHDIAATFKLIEGDSKGLEGFNPVNE
jgi:PAS domain-containing protein